MRGPLGWFAGKVLAWAFGDRWPYIDPLTVNPNAFDRIDRALRSRLQEPACPDFHLLAREIIEAPDAAARQMAVGRLLAIQINELKIARVTAYVLGQTCRQMCHARQRRHDAAAGSATGAPGRELRQ